MFRHLRSIWWKNLVIRKRHWLLTVIEVIIPIVLFTLVAYGRSKIRGMNKIYVKEPTFHDITSLDDIYSHDGRLNLWFSPATNFTQSIIKKVQEKLAIPGDAVKKFNSNSDLLKYFRKHSSSLVAAVMFSGSDQKHLNYDLTIYDKYFTWNTDKLFIPVFATEKDRLPKYIYKGYVALQVAIDFAYLELNLEKDNIGISFSLQEFPDPPRTIDSGFNKLFIYLLPLTTLFCFILLFPAVLQRVGEEETSGSKEYLKMSGFNSFTIWLGWFIYGLTTNLFSIVVIVILMKVPFWGVSYPLIEYSDGTVLFVFLFLYCMAATTFCFLVATIVKTPSVATITGLLVWISSYIVLQIIVSLFEYFPWKFKIPFTFLPNMALYYGYSSISVYETRETGVQWNNIFQPGSGDENDITMGNVFLMLIFDMVVFMLLTLYIENIKPGKYGTPKPYSFPLTSLGEFLKKVLTCRFSISPVPNLLNNQDKSMENLMQTNNLDKRNSKHCVVDNLNLEIRKNCITVLLGENGAGKSTILSILTGKIHASHGSVFIEGKSIREHKDKVKQCMGICPEHNLLFPDLTVEEHLYFFAMLKGCEDTNNLVQKMLKTLGILDKKCALPNALSGSMKRKLCLGIVLIGNREIFVLDEPTSGMDPESRRKIWNLLLEYKKSKTILITTSLIDEEADVLGDFIAIMAKGKELCYGTPFELKAKYNTGDHLCLLLKSTEKKEDITQIVTKHFPDASIIRENDDSVVYLLPLLEKCKYSKLIDELETNQKDMYIDSINMNLTTLNDVFLKATDEFNENDTTAVVDGIPQKDATDSPLSQGMLRLWIQFLGLIKKRFYFLKRKIYWFILTNLLSMCILLLALSLATSNNDYENGGDPSLNLSLEVYGKPKVYYGGNFTVSPVVTSMRHFYAEIVSRENGHPMFADDVLKGIINESIANMAFFKRHMIAAAEFNLGADQNEIMVNCLYSPETRHGVPISINLAMNAITKTLLNNSYSITTINTPLKPLYAANTPSELSFVNVAIVWLMLIPISMFFFMSNFIVFPNTEVSTNFIQIQMIAGIKPWFYWSTNVVFDFISSLLPLTLVISLVSLLNALAYNHHAFNDRDIWALMAIFTTYVFTSLPFTYLLSYRKTISGGFTLLLMFVVFTGIIPTLVVISMEFSRDDHYMKLASYLRPFFIVLCPQFGLGYISVKFSKKYVENFNWKYMDPNKRNHICDTEPNPCCEAVTSNGCYNYQSYFTNRKLGIQQDLLLMLVSFVVYFTILLFLNSDFLKKVLHILKYPATIFSKETGRNKWNAMELMDISEYPRNQTLRVRNLKKTFGKKTVVNNLNFHLQKNKCFGLLGVNGAGKSTTFRMLIKHLFFDEGNIRLKSKDKIISISQPEYCENIGYCPQEDCLNFFLTGRELLLTMASLKGYSSKDAKYITDYLLDSFSLTKYADIPCYKYSGGNKRKLSASLAFVGFPKVILLDEPTSGVDPESRRKFWNILSSFKKHEETSFLLCSHSMEECENLCDEIAIMKDGEITDQYTTLDLKRKYQKGFKIITVRLKSETTLPSDIKEKIENKLSVELKEEFDNILTYQVKDQRTKLSTLFFELEKLQEIYDIQCFVTQIPLEDIFLTV